MTHLKLRASITMSDRKHSSQILGNVIILPQVDMHLMLADIIYSKLISFALQTPIFYTYGN